MIFGSFFAKIFIAVSVATGMQLGIMSVDSLVLCSNNQDRKVSVKSVTMRGTTFQVVSETLILKLEFVVHVQLRFFWEGL